MSATAPLFQELALGLFAGVVLLPAVASAQQVQFYHLDALGNVRAVTDPSGNVVERHDYLPFGEECTTGPCASNPGITAGQPKHFTGKERDTETGLDYFGARYYRGNLGRFTTVDPTLDLKASRVDPQRWNRYSYGLNNPLRYVDPDGREAAPEDDPDTLGWILDQMQRIQSALGMGNDAVPNIVFQEGQPPRVVGVDRGTVKKAAVIIGTVGAAIVISDILKDSTPGKESKQTIQYKKEGGLDQANRDFDALGPQDVKDRGAGLRTGTLPSGEKVVVRAHSSEGSPTLEIQRPGDKAIKVRYPESKPADQQ